MNPRESENWNGKWAAVPCLELQHVLCVWDCYESLWPRITFTEVCYDSMSKVNTHCCTHIQWHTKRSIYVQHSYYINPNNFVNPNILFLNHQQTYSVQTKSIHSQISNSLLNMTDYNLYNTNADRVSSQILLQERRWSPISKKPSDRRPPALLSDLNVSL